MRNTAESIEERGRDIAAPVNETTRGDVQPYLADSDFVLYNGDALGVLRELHSESVDCVITSPPYWGLRDYSTDGQLGLEPTPEEYVTRMVEVFREVRRVLAKHGTCWVNMGDSYNSRLDGSHGGWNGSSPEPQTVDKRGPTNTWQGTIKGLGQKQLMGMPWRLAFALQADGWYLRSDIVWSKPNPMPESVTDRPTKAHEYVFLLAKGQWKTRVVQLANLDSKRIHLGDHAGPKNAAAWAHDFGVRLASAILDGAKLQDEFGLPSLDSEVWQERGDHFAGSPIASHPVEHRAAVYAARFLASDVSAKEFLQQLDGLGIALSDTDELLVLGRAAIPLPPGVDRYGQTAIAIHDSGEIGELDFSAHTLKFSSPSGCSYFFDQEAVREPHATPIHAPGNKFNAAKVAGPMDRGGNSQWERDMTETWGNPSGRNIRSVWEIATQPFPEAHFATFPEELVRRCLLAGCPEQVCGECGKAREREVDRKSVSRPDLPREHPEWRPSRYDNGKAGDPQSPGPGQRFSEVTTLGFTDCGHNAYRPGIVLDPFLGSGTVALVARKHGRRCVGIELNPAYCEMAAKRTQQLGLFSEVA